MSKPNDHVDGTHFSEEEYEIAISNGLTVDNYRDAPKGEAVEEEAVKEDTEEQEPVDNDEPEGEVANEEQIESNVSEEATEDDSEDEDEFKDLPKGFKKRLKRETRKVGRLERELAELKARLNAPKDETPTVEEELLPRDYFASDAEYNAYKTHAQAIKKATAVTKQQERIAQEQQKAAQEWNQKIQSNFTTQEELDDYVEAIENLGNPANYFSEEELEYIFRQPSGPVILKFFADNDDILSELSNMHKFDRADALKTVARKLQTKKQPAQQHPKPKSKAPQPVGSLTSKAKGVQSKRIENMSDEELISLYNSGKYSI